MKIEVSGNLWINLFSAELVTDLIQILCICVSQTFDLPVRVHLDVKLYPSPEWWSSFTSEWDHSAFVWLGPPAAVCDFSLCPALQRCFIHGFS